MTNVKILNDKSGLHRGFEVSGHSGYAKSGNDIVCAAISVLTTNTINSIETFTDDFISYESDENTAFMKLILEEESSHDAQLLMDAMILGLSTMAKAYPKNVRLTIEEV